LQIFDAPTLARFRRIRRGLIIAAVILAVAAPATILLGAVGSKAGWFGLTLGFDWLAIRVAPALAVIAAALGALALVAALILPPRHGAGVALFAMALGGVTFGALAQWRLQALQAPPVHDVATDWTSPLLFSPKLMLARGPDSNAVESNPTVPLSAYTRDTAGQSVAAINARTCPGATPTTLAVPPVQAFAQAKRALMDAHLKLVTDDPAHGLLEATATSFWFGFKDDVAVQVRPSGAGARIDLRASSRLGLSDFGRDCRLVTRLRGALAGSGPKPLTENSRPE
jgi:fatty-acyl-CoA synthase